MLLKPHNQTQTQKYMCLKNKFLSHNFFSLFDRNGGRAGVKGGLKKGELFP